MNSIEIYIFLICENRDALICRWRYAIMRIMSEFLGICLPSNRGLRVNDDIREETRSGEIFVRARANNMPEPRPMASGLELPVKTCPRLWDAAVDYVWADVGNLCNHNDALKQHDRRNSLRFSGISEEWQKRGNRYKCLRVDESVSISVSLPSATDCP